MSELLLPGGLSVIAAALIVAVCFLASLIAAAVGIGGGMLVISVMVNILPPAVVLPIHGVIQLGSNGSRAWLFRREVHWPLVGWFVLGSVAGVIAGASVFVALPADALRVILGLFILWSVWAPKLKGSEVPERGFVWVGAVGTFLTMFIGATGPFLAAFLTPDRFERTRVVGTHAACMVFQHAFKVVAFMVLGFAFLAWVPLLAVMLSAGFLGTVVGRRILLKIPEKAFAIVFKLVLTVLALRLLWGALFA